MRRLWIVIVFLLVGTFLQLAAEIQEATSGATESVVILDQKIAEFSYKVRADSITPTMSFVTEMGSVQFLAILVVVGAVINIALKQYFLAAFLLATGAGAGIISATTKIFYNRDRPYEFPMLAQVETTSFPSGHSLGSAAIFIALGITIACQLPPRSLRILIFSACLVIPILIGMSRIYLGVHYFSDVVGGILLGAAWTLFCWEITNLVRSRKSKER